VTRHRIEYVFKLMWCADYQSMSVVRHVFQWKDEELQNDRQHWVNTGVDPENKEEMARLEEFVENIKQHTKEHGSLEAAVDDFCGRPKRAISRAHLAARIDRDFPYDADNLRHPHANADNDHMRDLDSDI